MANKEFDKKVGFRLQLARDDLGILDDGKKATQANVAERLKNDLNLSVLPPIGKYEQGVGDIDLEQLAYLSRLYHVSLDYLLFNSDSENPANESIRDRLGLSDAAIDELSFIKRQTLFPESSDWWEHTLQTVNLLLTTTYGKSIIQYIYNYIHFDYDAVVGELPNGKPIITKAQLGHGEEFLKTGKTDMIAFDIPDLKDMLLVKIQGAVKGLRNMFVEDN